MGNSTQFLQLKKKMQGEYRRQRGNLQMKTDVRDLPTNHSAWALFGTLFK